MMKRLKTMMATIKHGDDLLGHNGDGEITSSVPADVRETHLRHTAHLRSSHLSERGRHERIRHRARDLGTW
jgi:hypothetical protein